MDARNLLVHIWETEGLGLVVFLPTRVFYTRQVGGISCAHPEAQGVYVLLRDHARELEAYFIGPKWGGLCTGGIDDETADFIDAFLDSTGLPGLRFIRVDRTRLQDSREAWVYVDVDEQFSGAKCAPIENLGAAKGILTWPNSD
jgi:hypothetical protein